MTARRDLDNLVRAYLDEGPTELPNRSFDAVRHHIDHTRQRVVLGPWRLPTMNRLVPIGLGAAALVAVLVVGSRLLVAPVATLGPGAGASPTPVATAFETPDPQECVDFYAAGGTYRTTVGTISLTATVPAGWHGARGRFYLINAPCVFGGQIKLEVGLVSQVYSDACKWQGTVVDAATPAALTAAIAAQKGHETVGPTDTTVGGYPAGMFELTFEKCDEGTLWLTPLAPGDPGDIGLSNIDPGTNMRLYVVDVDGVAVAVSATLQHEDATPARLAELDAIVASLEIEP